ncbi:Mbeg1-like protein [Gallaecimonas xiamenensis]|uniref:PAAR repeat-containing protein n=1 Tax=Gallaecimonas xiamenensis 3-C-1 TaxID=745411 RepID=K2J245_9GAMM|nr:Mbeg1-like protein [Gallaecimonas xiamenensis]EKE68912.1 PAAR repeat-containing protein [Gallaecimonas xiamenensis 3-C-1]
MATRTEHGWLLEDRWGRSYLCSQGLPRPDALDTWQLIWLDSPGPAAQFLDDLTDLGDLGTELGLGGQGDVRARLVSKLVRGDLKVWQLPNPWNEPGIAGASALSSAEADSQDAPRQQQAGPSSAAAAAPLARLGDNAEALAALDPVAARQQRYQARLGLIDQTAGIPEAAAANARLAFNNDNILRAEAAQYVYRVDEFRRGALAELPTPPVGLTLLEGSDVPGMAGANFSDPDSGFGAALFESQINGEVMLTYRGTNNAVTGKKDWATNFAQGMGKETGQYNQAMDLAKLTKRALGDDFTIVGHSLGGGLASAGVAVTGQPGYTFNSAGLHPKTAARLGGLSNADAGKLIQSQAVDGEILTMAQKYGNAALSGLLATAGGLLGGPLGAVAGLLIGGVLPDIPEAIGSISPLPSVQGGNPIARHGMDQVIAGIESQKAEDISTLSGLVGG